ncbi:MAG TPA: carbohydrate binding domain-containing protein [Polyangiaceae bacterium]|nr:carbohydrate binding domain-containing protein [Polyangiaceae bacterium]
MLLAFACGGEDKSKGCATGSERCACYGNDTCDGELVCLSHLCVSTMSSEGGASATGGRTASSGGRTGGTSNTSDSGAGGVEVPPEGTGGVGAGGEPTSETGGTVTRGGSSGTTGGTSTNSGGTKPSTGGTTSSAGEPGTGGVGEGGSPGVPDDNYISNGDFSAGSTDWTLTQVGTAVSTFTNGHACVQGSLNASFNLGWPMDAAKAFVVEPGVPYTLSFRAMAGVADFTLVVKIGHATLPYTDVVLKNTQLTTAWASYSFPIVAPSGDSGAGLVFQGTLLNGNSVCFDDVVFVKN